MPFLYAYMPLCKRYNITLRHWIIASYTLSVACAVWCSIGRSPTSRIGFKRCWEFYLIQILQSIATSISNVAFRVLFPQMFL